MLLEFNNGCTATVLLGTKDGDIYAGETWGRLESIGEDFTLQDSFEGDVVRIYQPIGNIHYLKTEYLNYNKDYLILWQREEPKEMTIEEIQKELGYKVKIIEEKSI
jgi:hypothetical protein